MSIKHLSLSVITSLFLGVVGILVFPNVQAQTRCGGSFGSCTAPLICTGGICNVPPPIWDSSLLLDTQAGASFDIENDGIVGNELTVGNYLIVGDRSMPSGAPLGSIVVPGDVYTNAIYSRETNPAGDNIWIGNSDNDSLRVRGTIFTGASDPPTEEVITRVSAADSSGLVVVGTGRGRTVSLRDCSPNQILKRSVLNRWECALDAVGGGGGEGTADHGELDGLLDDDHTQYYRQSGESGDLIIGGRICIDEICRDTWPDGGGGDSLPAGLVNQTLRNTGSGWASNSFMLNDGMHVGIGAIDAGYPFNVVGDINATEDVIGNRLCIGGDCRDTWPEGGGGGDLDGSGILERIAFWTDENTLSNNERLHWDNTQFRLGIGTSSPQYSLDVNGDRIYLTNPSPFTNAEINLKTGTDQHWGIYSDRESDDLRFWRGQDNFFFGSSGDFVAINSVNSNGCFGSIVFGATRDFYDGDLVSGDGYREVDQICEDNFPRVDGVHQCTTDEVMESIHCGSIWTNESKTALRGIIPTDGFLWISNGAPSMPTPTNDCYGWTQTTLNGARGVAWYFDTSGGAGYARVCTESNRILCCS